LVEIARLGRVGVEEFILFLWCAEFVIIDFVVLVHIAELLTGFWAVVGGIEESVLVPRGTRELCPFDVVGEEFEGGHVLHVDLDPVGAAALDGVGHVLAVVGEADAAERHGAVVGERVGVEEDGGLAVEGLLHVNDALVLEAVVLRVDIAPVFLRWHTIALVVNQLRQSVLECAAERDVAQVVLCDFILFLDPFRGLGGGVVFEPAVRVGDLRAEVIVGDGGVHARLGVSLDGIAFSRLRFRVAAH